MTTVGIRELKGKLSAYLRMVKAGEVVQVTDRGQVVAELRLPTADGGPTSYPRLNQLIREGVVRSGRTEPPVGLYALDERPDLPAGTALEILEELRGER
jgi:antitoxin (DNA-binding transcriptional repressor) of toxin-antitoxin stability system